MGFFSDLWDGITGKGSDDAYKQAKADEEARRKEIEANIRRIEGLFADPRRAQEYQDFIAANRDYLFGDLDRRKGIQDRELKFALARSGLSGGSTDIDQNRALAETYLRGVAEAENRAQKAGANLQSADQQSKQNLISTILAGGDITTASQNATQMMQTNLAQGKLDQTQGAFENLFGDFGTIYKQSREAAGERRAADQYGLGSLFGPRPYQPVNVAGATSPYPQPSAQGTPSTGFF
jgi:hypothetical protein